MFDFQKLDVYQKSKRFYIDTKEIIHTIKLDNYIKDQLSRAAFSVPLNLAEGSGKFSKADRKNYYTTARASLYECIAILDILHEEKKINELYYQSQLKNADELASKPIVVKGAYTLLMKLKNKEE
jgi:four helix bundle protein